MKLWVCQWAIFGNSPVLMILMASSCYHQRSVAGARENAEIFSPACLQPSICSIRKKALLLTMKRYEKMSNSNHSAWPGGKKIYRSHGWCWGNLFLRPVEICGMVEQFRGTHTKKKNEQTNKQTKLTDKQTSKQTNKQVKPWSNEWYLSPFSIPSPKEHQKSVPFCCSEAERLLLLESAVTQMVFEPQSKVFCLRKPLQHARHAAAIPGRESCCRIRQGPAASFGAWTQLAE